MQVLAFFVRLVLFDTASAGSDRRQNQRRGVSLIELATFTVTVRGRTSLRAPVAIEELDADPRRFRLGLPSALSGTDGCTLALLLAAGE